MFSEIKIILSLIEIIGDPKKNQDDRSLFVLLHLVLQEMRKNDTFVYCKDG